uniref:NAC domain-containing protein n=1 Tax=Leersia perrieri TaxID=77586 RepID=A0A0D9XFH3_9ORYZ
MATAARQQLPPGFRFHPTDEELVVQYLRRRALSRPLPAAVIPDLHHAAILDPWLLPGAGEGEAYFFSFRRSAAMGGGRGGGRRRKAGSGYWKATGTEKPVFLRGFGCGGGKQQQQLVGVKTTLVFVRAKPPCRTGWVMHEYRLAAAAAIAGLKKGGDHSCMSQTGEWVVCRIFLKNNRSSSKRRLTDVDSQTPVTGVHDGVLGHRRQPSPSPSPSSSSCVTVEVSDEEEAEVSSGSINSAPTVASQREA